MGSTKRLRVLVVDDNNALADTLADVMTMQGHTVHVAYDADSGLQLARDVLPDIIFHDIQLPDMNGYDAARRLRDDGRFNGTTLVAITGTHTTETARLAKSAGFDRLIPKPVEYAAMLDVLHATIAKAQ